MMVMLERTTKLVNGEERLAVRWGPDGPAYACTADGDCTDAEKRATHWGAVNAPARPAGDDRRRRFTAR